MKAFKFGLKLFKKYLWQGVFYLVVLLMAVILSLLLVQISRYVLDFVLNPISLGEGDFFSRFISSGALGEIGSYKLLMSLCTIFVGIVLLKMIIQYIGGIVAQNYGNKFAVDLRNLAMGKMLQRGRFESLGDAYVMLTFDVFYTKELFQTLIPQMISFVFYSLVALVMLFFTHWTMGVFMLASAPIVIVLLWRYVKATKPYFLRSRNSARKLAGEVSEAVSGILDIKTNGYEDKEIEVLERRNVQYNDIKKECTQRSNKFQMYFQIFRAAFYASIVVLAGYLAMSGEISIGSFSVAVAYGIVMLDNIVNTAIKLYQVQEALTYANNLRGFVEKKSKLSNNKTKINIERAQELCATKLSVEGVDGHNLNNLNFKVSVGDCVGFWVRDDRGCHALNEVLTRQVEPKSGGVSVDGVDYKEIKIKALRANVSSLVADPYLFNKTIKENIVLFEKFDQKRYDEVLRVVGLDKVLKNLPEKDDELVDIKNEGYSSHLRQMIGLARALYKDSSILILEKPLQAFALEKVAPIMKKISKQRERAIIVISPTLDVLSSCDKVFVVCNSQIEEVSTVEEIKRRLSTSIESK